MNLEKTIESVLSEMKCWKGYKKVGTKKSSKTGKRVNDCKKIKSKS